MGEECGAGSGEQIVKFDAVLFDVGDTLLHVPNDPHLGSLKIVERMGRVSYTDYKSAIAQAQDEWQQQGGLPEHEDLTDTWISHTHRALEILELEGDILLAAEQIEHSFLREGWEVYSEAHEALDDLRASGVRMGVVSNWPPSLEETLVRANLSSYFEVVVASGVVGYAKPHPQIFRIALNQMGVEPERALFVGDKVHMDVEGAAGVGMPSVLIDRDNRHEAFPNRIESLRGILECLV